MAQTDEAIFIGRDQQIDLFEIYLKRWQQLMAEEAESQVKTAPSPDTPLEGLIALLYGRGGFGKTTLLHRYYEIATAQPHLISGRPINWQFAMNNKHGLLTIVQAYDQNPTEFFTLLRRVLADALAKREDDFRDYKTAVKDIEDAQSRVRSALSDVQIKSQKDDAVSGIRGLTVDALMLLMRHIPPAELVLKNEKVAGEVEKVLGAGVQVSIEQLIHVYQKVRKKLGSKLDDYREPEMRLGQALGRDLARFARNYPLLIFFDTYEEIDEADALIRIVMGAAGHRVGWVIAGRSNLWAGVDQRKRRLDIEYGYKDIVKKDRALPIDFNVGGVGPFTVRDIIDYFSQLKKKSATQSLLNAPNEEEAVRILQLTQGVPLAVSIAAMTYQETQDLSLLTQGAVGQREIVRNMVERYLLHTLGNQEDKQKLYGLAMLRRSRQPEAVAAALNLTAEQARTAYDSELSRLHLRYSFIFSEYEEPTLHQEVRFFLRQWLRERHLQDPGIQTINNRIKQAYETLLKDLEASRAYSDLKERLEDNEWLDMYIDYIEQLFWLDPFEGVRRSIPLMVAASIYRPETLTDISEVGDFFSKDFSQPYLSWWNLARDNLLRQSSARQTADLTALQTLEGIITQRRLTFKDPVPEYQQELQALLAWQIGDASPKEQYQQAIKHYEQALAILPLETTLQYDMSTFLLQTAQTLFDERHFEDCLKLLDKVIALNTESTSIEAYLYRGLAHISTQQLEQALDDFSQVIALDPDESSAYFLRGAIHNEYFNNYEQALKDYEKALEIDPNEALIYADRALVYSRGLNRIDLAQADLDRAIEIDPDEATVYHGRALIALDLVKTQEALREENRSLELNPEFAPAYVGRGMIYTILYEFQRAEQDFQRALELDDSLHMIYSGLATLEAQRHNWKLALQHINHAQQLNPQYFGIFHLRGMIYYEMQDYEHALEDLQQALTLNPNFATTYYGLGLIAFSTLNYQTALEHLTHARELNPQFPAAYYGLGLVYTAMQEYQQARQQFDYALDLNPDMILAYYGLGNLALAQEDFDAATQEFNKALDHNPAFAEAYLGRGRVSMQMGKYRQAIQEFHYALEIQPLSSLAFYYRGSCYIELQDYQNAAQDLNRALELDPRFAPAYAARALLYFTQQEFQEAEEDCERALDLNPRTQMAYYVRGLVYGFSHNFELALEDFQAAIEIDPAFFLTYHGRGLVLLEQGENEAALEDFERVIATRASFHLAYFGRGRARLELGDPQGALEDFERVLAANAMFPDAYVGRGRAYADMGNPQRAIQNFNHAISLNAGQLDAYFWRGSAYFDMEEYTQALQSFEITLQTDPDHLQALIGRAMVYAEKRKYSLALADYEHVLTLSPDNPYIYYLRGQVYSTMGNVQHALSEFNRALDGNADLLEAYKERAALHIRLQQHQAAIDDLTYVLTLNPGDSTAYEDRADAARSLGQMDQVFADYTKALETYPEASSLYNKRGTAYLETADYERALEDFNEAIERDKKQTDYYLNRGACYLFLRKTALALNDLQYALALDPEDIDIAWLALYTTFDKARPGLQIVQRLQRIADQAPASTTGLLCQALVLSLHGKIRAGLTTVEHALTEEDQRADLHFWKGMLSAYYYRNQDENALKDVKYALELGLPPLLLTPLYWFAQDRPDFYAHYAQPLLSQYNV